MAAILVLEDNEELAELLELALEHAGHAVTRTPNGVRAAVHAAREPFDVALLDIDVEELSGVGVARAIAAFDRTAIVIMSGRATPWQAEALRAGATACLAKPFSLDALLGLIGSILDGDAPRPIDTGGDVRRLRDEDLERVRSMSRDDLDALPYGVIRIDRAGMITAFNSYESRASRLAAAGVIGMRFTDLAPCFEVKRFMKRAADARAKGANDDTFAFVFPHHDGLCRVNVRVFDASDDGLWLFVSKRRADLPSLVERSEQRREPPIGQQPRRVSSRANARR